MISPNDLFGGVVPERGNIFLVAAKADGTVLVNKPVMGALTPAEAINLAAYLLLAADPSGEKLKVFMQKIKS